MEFGMYQNATKSKLSELHQHKKILKKEVIDLRNKIDELGSETNMLQHKCEHLDQTVKNEQQRNQVLEKYVSNMEKQVSVQQNMMEIMSINAGASVLGRVVGPNGNASVTGSVAMHNDNNSYCGNASVDPLNTPFGTPQCTPRNNQSYRAGFGAPYQASSSPAPNNIPSIPNLSKLRPPPLPISVNPNNTASSNNAEKHTTIESNEHQTNTTLDVINKHSSSAPSSYEQFANEPLQINGTSAGGGASGAVNTDFSMNGRSNGVPPRNNAEAEKRSLDNLNVPNDSNTTSSNPINKHSNAIDDNVDDVDESAIRENILTQSGKALSVRTMTTTNKAENVTEKTNVPPSSSSTKETKPTNELARRRERHQRRLNSTTNAVSAQSQPPQPASTQGHGHEMNKFYDNQVRYANDSDEHENEEEEEHYDDEKSRVSELTEDRTEKHIIIKHHEGVTENRGNGNDEKPSANNTPGHHDEECVGEAVASSSANRALQTAVPSSTQQNNQSYPPRFVLGLGASQPEIGGAATTATAAAGSMKGDTGRVGKPPKAATRVNSIQSPSNNSQLHYSGKFWSHNNNVSSSQPNNDEVTVSTMGSFASVTQLQQQVQPQHPSTQKLSVAQRARLEATSPGSGVNHIRVASPAKERNGSPTKERSTATTTSSSGNASVSSAERHLSPAKSRTARSESPSFFSSFGKSLTNVLDNSVLGVNNLHSASSGSESDDSDDDSSVMEDTTPNASPMARSSNNSIGPQTSASTLAERQKLQRERQIAFLKEQGLIKDKTVIQGGAGGGTSPVAASAPAPAPRIGLLRSASSVVSDGGSQVSVGSSRRFWRRGGGGGD